MHKTVPCKKFFLAAKHISLKDNSFYYTSRDLFTKKSIVTSEGNNFYCLMAVLPLRAQCYPEAYGEVRELT